MGIKAMAVDEQPVENEFGHYLELLRLRGSCYFIVAVMSLYFPLTESRHITASVLLSFCLLACSVSCGRWRSPIYFLVDGLLFVGVAGLGLYLFLRDNFSW